MLVDADGESDEPQIDWGDETYDQAGDIRQPSRDGGGPGDEMWGANQGESVGQVGDVAAEGIELPEGGAVPDLMDGHGGMEPGDLGGPDIGLDQMGELGNLAGAAAFGADGRIGEDLESGTGGDTGGTGGDTGGTGGDTGGTGGDTGGTGGDTGGTGGDTGGTGGDTGGTGGDTGGTGGDADDDGKGDGGGDDGKGNGGGDDGKGSEKGKKRLTFKTSVGLLYKRLQEVTGVI